jgi:hypothetical protein
VRLQVGGSVRVLPVAVVSRLGQLEELGCTSTLSSSSQDRVAILFPPAGVCQGGLPAVRAYFAAEAVDVELQGCGIRVEDVADLGAALAKVCVRSIDVSSNGALGTSGAAMLLEGLGRGVKSVSLKGTGLGLAAGEVQLQFGQKPVVCSDEDWARLEGALRGLTAVEAIDLSDNGALGASGVGRLVSCFAGEAFACVT